MKYLSKNIVAAGAFSFILAMVFWWLMYKAGVSISSQKFALDGTLAFIAPILWAVLFRHADEGDDAHKEKYGESLTGVIMIGFFVGVLDGVVLLISGSLLLFAIGFLLMWFLFMVIPDVSIHSQVWYYATFILTSATLQGLWFRSHLFFGAATALSGTINLVLFGVAIRLKNKAGAGDIVK